MRFISGSQLFSGKAFLKEQTVLVIDDKGYIEDILLEGMIEENRIEHHEGILAPGFINTHCHLELSHLKGKIPQHTGIVDFGLSVIKQRNDIPAEQQLEYMQQANKEMVAQGIVAVGDISNTAFSAQVKRESGLYYHSFVELIALNPERANVVFEAGLQVYNEFEKMGLAVSLAPHAPYSCSKELIQAITAHCSQKNNPTSIHNQESKAENNFFLDKTGDYLRLYETLGLSLDFFNATGKSSLQTVLEAFERNVRTLLVHNSFSDENDMITAKNTINDLSWCLCPNANLYIENTLPSVELLNSQNCAITLGTDSLASNTQLSVVEEINTLLTHKPGISLEWLLQAATWNGARFLGIDDTFGSLEKGKKPGINLLEQKNGKWRVKKLA